MTHAMPPAAFTFPAAVHANHDLKLGVNDATPENTDPFTSIRSFFSWPAVALPHAPPLAAALLNAVHLATPTTPAPPAMTHVMPPAAFTFPAAVYANHDLELRVNNATPENTDPFTSIRSFFSWPAVATVQIISNVWYISHAAWNKLQHSIHCNGMHAPSADGTRPSLPSNDHRSANPRRPRTPTPVAPTCPDIHPMQLSYPTTRADANITAAPPLLVLVRAASRSAQATDRLERSIAIILSGGAAAGPAEQTLPHNA